MTTDAGFQDVGLIAEKKQQGVGGEPAIKETNHHGDGTRRRGR